MSNDKTDNPVGEEVMRELIESGAIQIIDPKEVLDPFKCFKPRSSPPINPHRVNDHGHWVKTDD